VAPSHLLLASSWPPPGLLLASSWPPPGLLLATTAPPPRKLGRGEIESGLTALERDSMPLPFVVLF